MTLSDKLKKARSGLGKTQRNMAKAVGKSYRVWQQYEEGKTVPGGKVFESLVNLGFNINWFFKDDVPMFTKDPGLFEAGVSCAGDFVSGNPPREDNPAGHRDSSKEQDGKLSDVVDRWDGLPEKAKAKIHAQIKELTKPNFLNDPKAKKFKAHSRGLADFIWDRGCKDAGLPGMFDSKALSYIDKYIDKELSDIDLYDAAVSWAKQKLTVIKKVDKRNGNL